MICESRMREHKEKKRRLENEKMIHECVVENGSMEITVVFSNHVRHSDITPIGLFLTYFWDQLICKCIYCMEQ